MTGLAPVLEAVIERYRSDISAQFGSRCRFEPTCSTYALGAIRAHGSVVGLVLATSRYLRCRPGGEHGADPPPERRPTIGRLVRELSELLAGAAKRAGARRYYQLARGRGGLTRVQDRGTVGLGDVIGVLTARAGVRPCAGCKKRAAFLNRFVVLSRPSPYATGSRT